jgi:hypothetical protein
MDPIRLPRAPYSLALDSQTACQRTDPMGGSPRT